MNLQVCFQSTENDCQFKNDWNHEKNYLMKMKRQRSKANEKMGAQVRN